MRKFLIFVLLIFFNNNICNASNNIKIKFKVENEIITNIDLKKEEQYLISLNKNLQNIPKFELSKLAQKSLLNEKIKKKNIRKFL